MGYTQVAQEIDIEVLERTQVGTYEDVTILKTQCLGLTVKLHTKFHVLHGDIAITPCEENHRVDEKGQKEVDQHSTYHHKQSLPRRTGTELPWLGRLLHLLGIHRLIYHSCYLAVTAKGQPTYAIGGVAVLGFILKEMEPRIKKKIKLFYTNTKELGKKEMTALMQ